MNLVELYAQGECGIDDDGINELLNLKKLSVSNNSNITYVNQLVNLEFS